MAADRDIQRSMLPIPDRARVMVTTCDAKDPNTRFAPIERVRPPKGAPNVLVVQLDDVGKDSFSHLVKPEDRLRVVTTRQ